MGLRMESGEQRMEIREWRVGNREWRMEQESTGYSNVTLESVLRPVKKCRRGKMIAPRRTRTHRKAKETCTGRHGGGQLTGKIREIKKSFGQLSIAQECERDWVRI